MKYGRRLPDRWKDYGHAELDGGNFDAAIRAAIKLISRHLERNQKRRGRAEARCFVKLRIAWASHEWAKGRISSGDCTTPGPRSATRAGAFAT